jgi:hypothetical protein
MTATLPSELRDVFARSATAELITIDDGGRPHTRSVSPTYHQGGACIDIEAGYALSEPRVALLFAAAEPIVLVQGTARIESVLHVQPERVYAWSEGASEPRLFDSHLEEVRSGHNEEPEIGHAGPEGGSGIWDERLDDVDSALLACVAPDGFPFAARVRVDSDPDEGVLRVPEMTVGMPVGSGPACLHATDGPRVEGDLVMRGGGWVVLPHRILGG